VSFDDCDIIQIKEYFKQATITVCNSVIFNGAAVLRITTQHCIVPHGTATQHTEMHPV